MVDIHSSKEGQGKVDGIRSRPPKSFRRKTPIDPPKPHSKVVVPTKKRKVVSSSDSKYDVEEDV